MSLNRTLCKALVLLMLFGTTTTVAQEKTTDSPAVKESKLGSTRNVHQCGDLFLAGQFGPDDIDKLKAAGIKRVISLRTDGEIDWDQKSALDDAELEFLVFPFRDPKDLNDSVFDGVRKLLAENDKPTLFHCGSANRVGAVWMAYRVLDQDVDLETAKKEAKTVGLRTPAYEEKALEYIQRKSQPPKTDASGKKDINKSFRDPELDVDAFVKRFEIDNREVYAARKEILRALNLKAGERVADVGAGTGLYTRLFSQEVGDSGWVYAVDIAPKFIQHIHKTSAEQKLSNITGVLCREDSVDLPPETVDKVYVCDTYHHFEYPAATLESIHQAMKPGGELIIVDFERIPGKSREWILGHVRAGKATVREEIQQSGFEFVEEKEIPGLEENYFIRFKK